MTNLNNENINETLEIIAEMLIQNLLTESEAMAAEELVFIGELSSDADMGEIIGAVVA